MDKRLQNLYIVVVEEYGRVLYWNDVDEGWANFPGAASFATSLDEAKRLLSRAEESAYFKPKITKACFNADATLCRR